MARIAVGSHALLYKIKKMHEDRFVLLAMGKILHLSVLANRPKAESSYGNFKAMRHQCGQLGIQ